MPRDYVKYIYARNTIHMPRLVSRASLVLLNLFCNVRFSSPFNSRSPLLPGSVEQRELSEMEDSVAASPPLELRRPSSGPRPTTSVPPSLQSPGDRSTGNVAVTLIGLNRRFHNHFSLSLPRLTASGASVHRKCSHSAHLLGFAQHPVLRSGR